MKLREYFNKKLNKDLYISLYNKYNSRFYGNFLYNIESLNPYLDYTIDEEFTNINNFILKIKLIDYEYPLGLDSMIKYNYIKTKESDQNDSKRLITKNKKR